MSDERPPKAPDAQEPLLPSSLKTSLLRDLSSSNAERERVQASIAAALGGAHSSPILEQADAQMAARAGQLKAATVATGTSLASKVILSGLLLTSAAALTTFGLRRSEKPPPIVAQRREQAPAAAAPVEVKAPAEVTAQPKAAQPATKLEAEIAPTHTEPAAPSIPARTRRTRPPSAPPAPARATSETAAPATSETAAPGAAERGPTAAVRGENKPAAKAAPTLAGELALVRGASDALNRKDAKAALALLARYPQAYPAGSLAIEVQALRALALCVDKHPEAARARDAFLREHPQSTLEERVRSGCR